MDISSLILNDTYEVTITGPDGKDTDVKIEVYGPDSVVARTALLNVQRKKDAKADKSIEEMDEEDSDLMAAITKSWQNVQLDGKELEPTPENFKRAYMRARFLRAQVWAAHLTRSNFFQKA